MNELNPEPLADTTLVSAQKLSKWFSATQVLFDVDMCMDRGERIVVCGPSGSGKSTLIRCLNGLEPFQRGSLIVDGCNMSSDNEIHKARHKIGMVFQNFNLYPHLNVLNNCTLGPIWAKKQRRAEAEELALEYLERVQMSGHIDKFPGQLSGGQQQRVAIARALCMQPDLMLFDEPTSALDPEMVAEVLDVMKDLVDAGMSIVCVTHEMGFARAVADRIIFMADGRIVTSAPPTEFFTNASEPRVIQFLGQILPH